MHRAFRLVSLLALLLMLSVARAGAERPWYHTAHSGKPYVNPDLTPARVIGKTVDPAWNGQLVLWQGRIRNIVREGHRTSFDLDVGGALVPVVYRYKAVNLERDRTGYRVAVKGALQAVDGTFSGIDGRSIILLQPPAEIDYANYLKRNPAQQPSVESFLGWWISFHNPQYPPATREAVAAAIVRHARENAVDPLFLASLIQIESAFRVDIVSPSGAIGLGQLMPFTARGFGVDPWNPQENVKAAARYIANLLRMWRDDARRDPRALALASYNAGPGSVRGSRGIPPYPQTTNYVYFIGLVHENMTSAAARAGVVSPASP